MITRKVPFEGMTSMQIIAAVGFRKQKLPPPLIPNPLPPSLAGMDRFVEVMESCFSEPGRRPSMSQILSELCSIVQANNQSIAEYPPLRKNFSSSLAETTRPSSPSLRRTLTDSSYYDAKHAVETPATASLQTPLQKGPKEWMHLAPLDFSQLEF